MYKFAVKVLSDRDGTWLGISYDQQQWSFIQIKDSDVQLPQIIAEIRRFLERGD